jgi:hypothetical protein
VWPVDLLALEGVQKEGERQKCPLKEGENIYPIFHYSQEFSRNI